VRVAVSTDAVKTFRLMNFFLSNNFYRQAILSSRQILDLAGMNDASTLSAPQYFNHIRFGFYFRDAVQEASRNEDLNVLFLLAVIRQESLFEPFAYSGAGARGLMQIIPSTGQEIASQLNWPPNYADDDLDRAIVSIQFGARYLARQRDYFNGSLFAALAAYNGGPGNTQAWADLAKGDPDLLFEVIRADETRTYIKQIYEFFNLYRLIYEEKP
jgi:soluble lytic murein transglycosylase